MIVVFTLLLIWVNENPLTNHLSITSIDIRIEMRDDISLLDCYKCRGNCEDLLVRVVELVSSTVNSRTYTFGVISQKSYRGYHHIVKLVWQHDGVLLLLFTIRTV